MMIAAALSNFIQVYYVVLETLQHCSPAEQTIRPYSVYSRGDSAAMDFSGDPVKCI